LRSGPFLQTETARLVNGLERVGVKPTDLVKIRRSSEEVQMIVLLKHGFYVDLLVICREAVKKRVKKERSGVSSAQDGGKNTPRKRIAKRKGELR
jgi:hypothetical protein